MATEVATTNTCGTILSVADPNGLMLLIEYSSRKPSVYVPVGIAFQVKSGHWKVVYVVRPVLKFIVDGAMTPFVHKDVAPSGTTT